MEGTAPVAEATELRARVVELETAIRRHRDQKADDRCWMDDLELYAVLGDRDAAPDNRVGDKLAMLESCRRFVDVRCAEGHWPSHKSLREAVRAMLDLLVRYATFARAFVTPERLAKDAALQAEASSLLSDSDIAWKEITDRLDGPKAKPPAEAPCPFAPPA